MKCHTCGWEFNRDCPDCQERYEAEVERKYMARYQRPPCLQCGAMTADEATSRCMGRAAGDGRHGTELWSDDD